MKKLFYFIKNIWKYKKFLWNFREWSGGYYIIDFLKDFSESMIKFYSNPKNCWQVDESRLDAVEQLNKLKEMLVIADDELYFLRDIDFEFNEMFKDGKYNSPEDDWTIEEIEESEKKYMQYRKEMFEYINKYMNYWWTRKDCDKNKKVRVEV